MNAKDIAYGYATGYNDGLNSSGSKPEEDWAPPADWPDVPEPSDYEMCFLIDVSAVPQAFSFRAYLKTKSCTKGTLMI